MKKQHRSKKGKFAKTDNLLAITIILVVSLFVFSVSYSQAVDKEEANLYELHKEYLDTLHQYQNLKEEGVRLHLEAVESARTLQKQKEVEYTTKPDKTQEKPTSERTATIKARYTPGNCADEVKKYPWPKEVALAIMMAESHGIEDRIGDTHIMYYQDNINYGASYGCMQIRHLPGRPSPKWLMDAKNNVEYAYHLYQKRGWQPWSVYKSGRYKEFLK